MYGLLAKCKRLCLPVDIKCQLFKQLIVPILLYGCETWGFENIEQIEVLHRKFLKNMLHVQNSTPSCMVYGETGENKLSYIVVSRMLNYWCRLITGNHNKISFIMFKLLKVLHENQIFESKWITKVKESLNNCGFSNLWYIQDSNTINPVWFKNALNLRLSDMSSQNLLSEIGTHECCSNYRIFKETICVEPYLDLLNFRGKNVLTRLRCRNYMLPVNSDRYSKESKLDQYCKHCNNGEIGDEFHYLLTCPKFTEHRRKFIDKYYYVHPNTIKLKRLLQTKKRKTLINLVKFIEFTQNDVS